MDQKFWDEFNRRTKAFRSTKQYQEYCWDVYRKNKALIKEFVKWRTFLNIDPDKDSTADSGLGYLVEQVHKHHLFRWKSVLNKIMNETKKYSPGLYQTYLLKYVDNYYLEYLNARIKEGKGDEHNNLEYMKSMAESLVKMAAILDRYLKAGKISFLMGPPAEYLPEWLMVAVPENKFYQEEKLEKVIQPLIDQEIAEDNKELIKINELHLLLSKHAWNTSSTRSMLNYLRALSQKILEEIEGRKTLKFKIGLEEAHKQQEAIKRIVLREVVLVKKIENAYGKEVVIPSKEVHQRVQALIDDLKKDILNRK